jgi:energy-coupling factor transporter ATP-binding protein EcfA2
MFHLKKLKLNWYGPLSFQGEAEFKPGVNLIIGKNGSGKTLTLRMLDNASKGQSIGLNQNEIVQIEGDELVKLTLLLENNDVHTITFNKGGGWQNIHVLQNKIRFITSDRSVRGDLRTPNPFRQISDFFTPEPGTEINISDEFNKAIIFELLQRIKKLKESIPDLTKEIENDYRMGMIDFEKDIRVDFDRDSPVYFVDYKGREVQILNLSAGEKEYLYFYSFLRRIRDEENKIILIDEPELHLHGNQIRKLCELIEKISQKNQIIIATHSGDILYYFLRSANIVLLNKGIISNVSVNEDLKKTVEEIGLPIDPSFFTAHWICAENNPDLPIKGENAPTTLEILGWMFGNDISKRFWAFGGNKIKTEAVLEIFQSAVISSSQIQLSVILDGDKLVNSPEEFPPNITDKTGNGIYYFPFWELENIFLCPYLLNSVITRQKTKEGFDLIWEKIEQNKEKLLNSISKTIMRNYIRKFWKDKYFRNNPKEDLKKWKEKISKIKFNQSIIDNKFKTILKNKNWKWVPGKEVISFIFDIESNFWNKIRELVENKNFIKLIEKDDDIKNFIEEVSKTRE